MLTITETIDAINAIDTDPDVLHNAMNKILGHGEAKDNLKAHELAIDILHTYSHIKDTPTLVHALCIACATCAAMSTKQGREVTALSALNATISEIYIKTTKHRFMQRLEKDPEAGLQALLDLVEAVGRMKE